MKYPREVVEAAVVLVPFFDKIGVKIDLPLELQNAVLKAQNGPTAKDLMDLWNNMRDKRLAACAKLTGARRRAASARLREFPEVETWVAFMNRVNSNTWCLGLNPSPGYPHWKANFDWFIRPDTIVKFVEGGYRNDLPAKPTSSRDLYGDELDQRSAWAEHKGGKQ